MQRQYKEAGKQDLLDCSENWFNCCNDEGIDTRSIPKG